MNDTKYNDRLSSEEWGNIYNINIIESIIEDFDNNRLSFQTIELMKKSKEKDAILEIGSGSGATSVYLAMNNRKVTALDFSKESLQLTDELAKRMQSEVKTIYADATKELPFEEDQFDIIFQAVLLEHFEKDERI